MKKRLPIFTNSSMTTFRNCRWEYYLRYVLGIQPERKATALRFGGSYAKGIEMLGNGYNLDEVLDEIRKSYSEYPEWCVDEESRYKYDVERESLCAMIEAWSWRYSEESIDVLAAELPVSKKIKVSGKNVLIEGMIDQITSQLGKRWQKEFKTAGEDIQDGAKIWMRMRNAPQATIYSLLLAGTEYEGIPIMYDYIRKPEIGPTKIPLTDEDGAKIVLDANGERVRTKDGKKWRESGDKDAGYILQTRPETPKEFGDRLYNDMINRPEYYFHRREVFRTEQEKARMMLEVELVISDIMAATKKNAWYRNPGRNCDFCRFNGPCLDGWIPTTENPCPTGFVVLQDKHPELRQENDNAK